MAAAPPAGGGRATLSPDGSFRTRPDVAIVVFGEQPYAEMRGDVATLEFQPGDKQALALLKKLKGAGIPTVSVFLSGRPLWTNPEINQSDAFVAAWFPGSEGAGIADVLIGGKRDFRGRLSFSWPANAGQFVLDRTRKDYAPLFPFGYGLSYKKGGQVPQLDERPGLDGSRGNNSIYFARGGIRAPFAIASDPGVARSVVDSATAQEGAMRLAWKANGTVRIDGPAMSLVRETNAAMNLQITYRVATPTTTPATLSLGGANVDVTGAIDSSPGWHVLRLPLQCFKDQGADVGAVTRPFAVTASAPLVLDISDLRLATDPAGAVCPAKGN